jgi:non-ribosomal peptide synthase protein (TIGR01720 family)
MHLLAQCRKEGISITLNQVLRARSLAHLAESVTATTGVEHGEAQTDKPFELSPIQRFYFQNIGDETNSHFNQSFTFRLSHKIDTETIKNALSSIVQCHAMLRARFAKNRSGVWQQRIQSNSAATFKFEVHEIRNISAAVDVISNTQKNLNIINGPLFAADLFNTQSGEQVLFICAHHLVIDVVSWRIILGDLEECINSGSFDKLQKELPFQIWNEKQIGHSIEPAQIELMKAQSFAAEPADLAFWGMDTRSNVYGDVERESFTLDEKLSETALNHHNVLRTDVVDYFVAAIVHSFSRVFVTRNTPTVFNESHGREPWESSNIDLSRTVGWFTSVYPIHVPISEDEDDVVQTVRQVKDLRRKIVDNGRSYVAHRFLTEEGKQRFAQHEPMEILFNYLGKSQHLESDDALFQPVTFSEEEEAATSDVGATTKRLALFEISASVTRGKINFDFMYNQNQKNRKGIRRWIAECQRTLEEIVSTLAKTNKPQPTLSDFPLLPLESYARLDRVIKTFPSVGISYEKVEDVYPCATMQSGMLLSQIKDPSAYWSFATFEVKSKRGAVDVQRMAGAWEKVVARHPALRTVFVDSVCKGGVFDQIVVKNPDTGLVIYTCEDAMLTTKLESAKYANLNGKKKPSLPHQVTIVQTRSGRVVVKMEINHAVIDGGSWGILTKDLQDAYEDRLTDAEGPLYSDYIKYLRSLPADAAINYWKEQLRGVKPCYFPVLPQHSTKERKLHTLYMDFTRFSELHTLSEKSGVTFANILLAAWALLLRMKTDSADVCYGYLSSGRNVPIDNIQGAIGAFINMLVSRVKIAQSISLLDIFQKVQNDFIDSLPHQHCSLAQFQHDLGLSGKALFNTAVSVQNYGASEGQSISDAEIEFENLNAHDPSEFSITVSIDATRGDEVVKFAYWTDAVSDDEAKNVSATMAKILTHAIADINMTVAELDTAIEGKPVKKPLKAPVITPPMIRPTRYFARANSDLSVRSTPRLESPGMLMPSSAPDWSTLIRNIVSEMVPQIVDQVMAQNKNAPVPAQSTVNAMTTQMTNMLTRKASMSTRGRPNLETGSLLSRRMSTASRVSDAGSRINVAADMVAAAGVMATEALKSVPADFVEKKLMTLWGELLDMMEESIEKDDSFFQLGGDSIIAMRLVGAAREEGLSMTVADVFKNPTFADMARVVRVAGEVIDQVMSQAGDEKSVTGNPSSSKPRIQLPERTVSAWKDFESMVSEHAIADDTTDGGNTPPAPQEEKTEPSFNKWQGFTSPTSSSPAAQRKSSKSYRLPTTIPEHPSSQPKSSTQHKSISLLGDPNVESVISKVQVFKGGISDVLPVTDFQSLAITGTLLESRWMLNHFYLDGEGPLDVRKLKQAAFRVVQAFDILRTVFVPYGDRFLQVVLRKLQPDFIFQETDSELDDFTTELRQKDREHGPRLGEAFVQFVVAKQKKTGQYRIFMRLSHAQYDGVCLPRILDALQAGYNGLPISTAPSFGTYVREIANAKSTEAHDHWREVLRGSIMTQIVDRYGPNYQRSAGKTNTLTQMLSVPTLSYVNITTASVLKAAWAATLAGIANKADIVFGHVISGRNSTVPNIESIVGPCLNMVPVRVVYRPEWTVLDLLVYIQDQQIANMPYESLGFREITRNCTDWPDWTNFSSVIQHNGQSILNSDDASFKLGGVEYTIGVAASQEDFADFSILSTSHGKDQVEVTLTYAPNSTITEDFAQHVFEVLCTNVITFSEDPYTLLPTPAELSSNSSTTMTSDVGRKKSAEKAPVSLPTNTGLPETEVANLATLLRTAWSQILRPKNAGTPVSIDLDTNFFDNGGDIMGLAQIASILDAEGLRVRVEDLLTNPVFVDQVGLLAEEKKKIIEKEEMSPWGEKGTKKDKEKKDEKERVAKDAKLERVESGLGKVLGKIRLRRKEK